MDKQGLISCADSNAFISILCDLSKGKGVKELDFSIRLQISFFLELESHITD